MLTPVLTSTVVIPSGMVPSTVCNKSLLGTTNFSAAATTDAGTPNQRVSGIPPVGTKLQPAAWDLRAAERAVMQQPVRWELTSELELTHLSSGMTHCCPG